MFRPLLLLVSFVTFLLATACTKPGKLRGCVKVENKFGYVDEAGTFVIDPQFDDAWSFVNGSAVVKQNGKYGLIGKDGAEVLSPRWDSVIPFSAQCFIVEMNGGYGFVAHGTGNSLLPATFDQVYYYTGDLCVVQKGHALGIVNAAGKLVCRPQLQDLKEMTGKLAVVVEQDTTNAEDLLLSLMSGGKNLRYGLINTRGELVQDTRFNDMFSDETGNWFYPFVKTGSDADVPTDSAQEETGDLLRGKYGIVDTAGHLVTEPIFDQQPVFGDGLFRINLNNRYGFADATGKVVIAPTYSYTTPFREGYAVATVGSKSVVIDKAGKTVGTLQPATEEVFPVSCGRIRFRATNGSYGYADLTGRVVIEPQFEGADNFVFNRAVVELDGRYGLIDRAGNWVVQPEWAFVFNLGDGFFQIKAAKETTATDSVQYVLPHLNGGIAETGFGGVIDTNGRNILPVAFDEIFHLQPGYFMVEVEGMTGCYATNGRLIYKPQSATSIYFFNGRTEVRETQGAGIIDTTGRYIVPAQFDSIGVFYQGFAVVNRQSRYGLIDSTGKIVVAPNYEELQPVVNGYAIFKENGKFGYLAISGEQLFSAKFDEASPLIDPDRKTFN